MGLKESICWKFAPVAADWEFVNVSGTIATAPGTNERVADMVLVKLAYTVVIPVFGPHINERAEPVEFVAE
jgi:hypothetical protein